MKTIPFLSLAHQHGQLRSEILAAIMKVYDKNVFVMGEELNSFQEEFARSVGVRFSLGVGNGLDALTLALRSCNVSDTDEVIVPAHTYLATWLAISRCNARIVPVEPDDSLNIDPARIEMAITARTKIILPVHLYGQACAMDAITDVARKHDLLIIEDNAQAYGARWDEKYTGSFGVINATSFYPSKNIGALGDGGAITTSDEKKAGFIKMLRNYGFAQKNIAEEQGVNSRLDEIQAAVLRIKLRHLAEWTAERRRLAGLYFERLNNVGDILLPVVRPQAFHVFHLFVVRTAYRNRLKTFLAERGIETMIHYPIPPHLQKAYQGLDFKKGDFPLTERAAETVLSLPLWPGLTDDQIFFIADAIRQFFHK